ncbi:hypothetical protein PVK06_009010 [Gossypium arboreum]|uniref:Putative plant transposon protein domain-containing protein n=1 Tax=Gossypium arboreum TaxID=29729 RepID=A0ABR0QLD2_GOSAR|nr:hypothetical protein PVK06_009010 [Gossypium arboreum]
MPRKRTRACAQIDETQNKFHCEEAKARYESIFKNQQMHPEKGFTLKESNYKDFMAHIRQVAEALNWELFCDKRPSVDKELVHEFYSNLTSSELTKVPAREIKVPITSTTINEFFKLLDFGNNEYSSLMSNIEPENLREILEELTVLGSKWIVSKQGIHTCRKEYFTPLAKTFWPSLLPFTITILCLKAKILANVKKAGYSQGTITDWDLYQIAGDSILQQQIEESEDPEEEEEDPTKIEPMQSAKIPDKVEPIEPEVEPDDKTSIFRAQPPSPDLRDELSKLMDTMQHIQWQQQAY